MASASTDASEIRRRGRQRLIGAVAIVLLLVVFIPMLLDSEPRRSHEEASVDIPAPDKAPPLPPPSPASNASRSAATAAPGTEPSQPPASAPGPAKAAAGRSAEAVVTPAPRPAASPPKPAPSAPKPGAAAPSPSPRPAEPASHASATPKLEGFAVQVGAFRDEAMLRQAREKLAAAGIPHYIERLDTSSGPLTRLRAGPFATRQAADGAAARLKAAALPSHVVPLP
ncbi:MAG TPA: SPOR domain-containing protein [Usitatibacter sp.]|jgi:DedD protein|nr:SPOR domain-containing protein [Usitatibacter sp.]